MLEALRIGASSLQECWGDEVSLLQEECVGATRGKMGLWSLDRALEGSSGAPKPAPARKKTFFLLDLGHFFLS